MRQPIRPDILHTLDFTRNPALAGGEEDTSRGFYDSEPEFTEPDDVKLRISREIKNMERALGCGYGAAWSAPYRPTGKGAEAISAPLPLPPRSMLASEIKEPRVTEIKREPIMADPEPLPAHSNLDTKMATPSVTFYTDPKMASKVAPKTTVTPLGVTFHPEPKMASKMAAQTPATAIPETKPSKGQFQPGFSHKDTSSGEEYMGTARARVPRKPRRRSRSSSVSVRRRLSLSDSSSDYSDDDTPRHPSKHQAKKSSTPHGKPRQHHPRGRRDSSSSVDEAKSPKYRKFKKKLEMALRTDTSRSRSRSRTKRRYRKSALQSAPKLEYEGKEKDDWDVYKGKFQDYTERIGPPANAKLVSNGV